MNRILALLVIAFTLAACADGALLPGQVCAEFDCNWNMHTGE